MYEEKQMLDSQHVSFSVECNMLLVILRYGTYIIANVLIKFIDENIFYYIGTISR